VFFVTDTFAVSLVGVSVGCGLVVGASVATSRGGALEFVSVSEPVAQARRIKRMMKIRKIRKYLDLSIFTPSPNRKKGLHNKAFTEIQIRYTIMTFKTRDMDMDRACGLF